MVFFLLAKKISKLQSGHVVCHTKVALQKQTKMPKCVPNGGKKKKKKLPACIYYLTLKASRKSASENVVCLRRLLHLLANFSNLHFAYRQTVWTQIRLLLKEQSDMGPHCLQQ